jgi:hypothetical protein
MSPPLPGVIHPGRHDPSPWPLSHALVETIADKILIVYQKNGAVVLDEIRMVRKIREVWKGIQKRVFVPNDTSWKCKGCHYQKACRDWFEKGEAA